MDPSQNHLVDARSRRPFRGAFSPLAVAYCTVLVLLLTDLSLAVAGSGPRRSSTPLLALPPLAEVLLLAGLGLLGALSARRIRRALLGAETARLTAEEGVKRLLQVIDNTSAIIYLRGTDGRYLLINRTYERLFGIKREDIVGLTDHDLFPLEIADAFRANDLKALERGGPIQTEEIAPHPDGPHTYITVKYPIKDAAGRHYAICGISTDITDLKHAEQEVLRLNADLEERVRERTRELEASTKELDAFAFSVSHDLRAPLRAVAGFSELLLEDHSAELDGTGKDYLTRVVMATARMGRLIDDLLKLSRASRGELTWQRVDLTAIARRITADLEVVESDPARLAGTRIDEGLVAAGDPALLELVMQNLISNAWKFTAKESSPLIHVGAEHLPGRQRVFFVRDNGVGFDMRYADKLFSPFQRLHSLEDFAGSGIGLAIVGRIINRHGGRIWAEGRPDEGAVFRFALPDRGVAP